MDAKKPILGSFLSIYKESFDTLPPRGNVTIHQKSLFLLWIVSVILWIYKKFEFRKPVVNTVSETPRNKEDVVLTVNDSIPSQPVSKNTLVDVLGAINLIGCILIFYFFCDFMHYFPQADRTYNRDLFIFLCSLLFLVALYFTSKETPTSGKLLNREQSEEWKGWMQVMFVWYHYFKAAETYNAIRIFIASYVFMTGFGNFSFFWVRKDYSLRRVLKMLFRLNFLVILACMVINNEYMLYYICPMHTLWFISVYIMMRPFHEQNENRKVMITKFIFYFLVVFIIYDVPDVAQLVYTPFSFFLNYQNSLHEWIFRTKLDHYATFIGMIFAYNHPNIEKIFVAIEMHRYCKWIHVGISGVMILISTIWYRNVYVLGKYSYNVLHPYTSFIPILVFLYFRNMTKYLRSRYLLLFTFLGKITLETYISQLHIYLQQDAKKLLVYIPDYPLVNFLVNSLLYIYMSYHLFHATLIINDYLFPSDRKKLMKNLVFSCLAVVVSYALVFVSMYVL